MAVVYRHIRLDKNEPFYIGIGKTERRAYRKDSRNSHWKNIILKTEYDIEILFDDLTWEQACEKEIELIKLYGRKDLGLGTLVNMTDGGDGVDFTPQVRKKISDSLKLNNPTKRDDVKLKISETLKEYFRNNKITHTEETKEKLRQIHLGKKLSEETKQKISEAGKGKSSARKGVKLTNETKIKLKLCNLGKKQSQSTIDKRVEKLKGRKNSDETKEKMRQAWIKRKEKQNNG
jgi:hypothetical protein